MDRTTRIEVILGFSLIIIGVAAFWFWSRAASLLAAGRFDHYAEFVTPVVLLVCTALLFYVSSVFARNGVVSYGAPALAVGVSYFFIPFSATVGVTLLVSLLVIFLAVHRIGKEYFLSLGFSVTKTARAGLPLFFTAVAVTVSGFYWTQLDGDKAVAALLPRSAFQFTLTSFREPLQALTGIPIVDPAATVNEVLVEVAREKLKQQGVEFSRLSPKDVQRLVGAGREELEKQFGVVLDGEEKIGDAFYRIVSERVRDLFGPYKDYVPFVSALAFFFAFKAFTFPLYYVTLLMVPVLLKVLVATRILHREKQQVEVERLIL